MGNDEAYTHQNENPCSTSISDYSGSDCSSENLIPGDKDVKAFLKDIECTPYILSDDSKATNVPIISAEQKEQGEHSILHTSQDESSRLVSLLVLLVKENYWVVLEPSRKICIYQLSQGIVVHYLFMVMGLERPSIHPFFGN